MSDRPDFTDDGNGIQTEVRDSPDMPASGMSAEPVGYARAKDLPLAPAHNAFWVGIQKSAYYDTPVYTADSLAQELAAKDEEIAEWRVLAGDRVRMTEFYAELENDLAEAEAHLTDALAGIGVAEAQLTVKDKELAELRAENERLLHEVESAGSLRLRMEAHRATATELGAHLARVTSPEYLTEALAKIGAVDAAQLTALKSLVAEALPWVEWAAKHKALAFSDNHKVGENLLTRLNEAVKP